MKVYEDSFNFDGGSCSLGGNVINWTMPTKDLGLLPYKQGTDGKITPVGVKRTLSNGKVTYYRQEAYQLSYKFSLDVQNENLRVRHPKTVQITFRQSMQFRPIRARTMLLIKKKAERLHIRQMVRQEQVILNPRISKGFCMIWNSKRLWKEAKYL